MPVKILFRLNDGIGIRKKGDIVNVRDDPKKDGFFGLIGKGERYGVIVLEKMDIKDFMFLKERHFSEYTNETNKELHLPAFIVRSGYQIDIDGYSKEQVSSFARADPVVVSPTEFKSNLTDLVREYQTNLSITQRVDKIATIPTVELSG